MLVVFSFNDVYCMAREDYTEYAEIQYFSTNKLLKSPLTCVKGYQV